MASYKINEMVILDPNVTDSGDVLGFSFPATMSFSELDAAFSPKTAPEIYELDESGKTTGVYKNRKVLSLRVTEDTADVVLMVTKGIVDKTDELIAQINEQAAQIADQATQIAAQAERIAALEDELAATHEQIENTEEMLTAMEEGIANA